MRKNRLLILASFTSLFFGAFAVAAAAGQLVTPQLKQQAKEAIRQEKQLAAVTKPRSLAILPFQNLSRQADLDPLQKGLAILLISDLANLDIVTVVERAELQALVEELGFGQSGLVDPATAPRIGRLVQAEYLIQGAFSGSAADRLSIEAQVISAASGRSLGRSQASGPIEQLPALEKALLDQLVTLLQLNPTSAQRAALQRPLSRDPAALMEYFKAIDAADRGQSELARQLFAGALARDPELAGAKKGLAELGPPPAAPAVATGKPELDDSQSKAQQLEQRRRTLRAMRERTSFTTRLAPALPVARMRQPFLEFSNYYTGPYNRYYAAFPGGY